MSRLMRHNHGGEIGHSLTQEALAAAIQKPTQGQGDREGVFSRLTVESERFRTSPRNRQGAEADRRDSRPCRGGAERKDSRPQAVDPFQRARTAVPAGTALQRQRARRAQPEARTLTHIFGAGEPSVLPTEDWQAFTLLDRMRDTTRPARNGRQKWPAPAEESPPHRRPQSVRPQSAEGGQRWPHARHEPPGAPSSAAPAAARAPPRQRPQSAHHRPRPPAAAPSAAPAAAPVAGSAADLRLGACGGGGSAPRTPQQVEDQLCTLVDQLMTEHGEQATDVLMAVLQRCAPAARAPPT